MILINYYGNNKKTGIYCIRNQINNKIYIGSTKRSFGERKDKHSTLLRKNKHHNEHLQNAWNYYGEENFSFEILFICSPEECEKHETQFIKLYSSNNRKLGYNIASVVGYGFEYKRSEKRLKEQSERKKKKSTDLNGLYTNERGISKPFKEYDMNGNLLKEYKNAIQYVNENNGGRGIISIILTKRKLFYRNKIILFSNETLTKEDIIKVNLKHKKKEVYLYDINDKIINEFKSVIECANFIGCKEAEVRMCCLGKRSRIKNFKTKYK